MTDGGDAIQRRGEWWQQRSDGAWLKWDKSQEAWVEQDGPPPPPDEQPAVQSSQTSPRPAQDAPTASSITPGGGRRRLLVGALALVLIAGVIAVVVVVNKGGGDIQAYCNTARRMEPLMNSEPATEDEYQELSGELVGYYAELEENAPSDLTEELQLLREDAETIAAGGSESQADEWYDAYDKWREFTNRECETDMPE